MVSGEQYIQNNNPFENGFQQEVVRNIQKPK